MEITCTNELENGKLCGSIALDQATDGKILCHKCRAFLKLVSFP